MVNPSVPANPSQTTTPENTITASNMAAAETANLDIKSPIRFRHHFPDAGIPAPSAPTAYHMRVRKKYKHSRPVLKSPFP